MLHGTRRALLGARKKYYQRVMGTNPTAYWPMWESSGSVSQDLVLAAQNGVYTGVTLGQPGIGDGRTSPFFDGALDFNDIFSLALQGNFNGAEGTMAVWARVDNVGVWVDGSFRRIFDIRADSNNFISVYKSNASNTLVWRYEANNVSEVVTIAGYTTVDWMCLVVSWSKSAEEMRAYFNGVQVGVTQVALGAWAGNLDISLTVIGAYSTASVTAWHGNLAHAALWTRPLTPTQIASLAVV